MIEPETDNSAAQPLPATELVDGAVEPKEEIIVNRPENLPVEPALPVTPAESQPQFHATAMEPPQESPPAQPADQKSIETPETVNDEASKKAVKTKDSVFDLFTDGMDEESDVSEFAAKVDNVDIGDLRQEIQSLASQLKGGRGK